MVNTDAEAERRVEGEMAQGVAKQASCSPGNGNGVEAGAGAGAAAEAVEPRNETHAYAHKS